MASPRVIFSNVHVYLDIAKEALSDCEKLVAENVRPRPDGKPGFIKTFDPNQRSFKHGLIAIAFSGIYLDALLRLAIIHKLGLAESERLEYTTYEVKLKALGIVDPILLIRTKDFRESRNEVMHEEPLIDGVPTKGQIRTAQEDAIKAVPLVQELATAVKKVL